MSKRARSIRGQASLSREETMEERVRKFGLFDNGNHQMNYNNLVGHFIHSGDVVDWVFLSNKGLAQPFFYFINTDTLSGSQWVNLFQINEPIFRELVRTFFASFEFDATLCRYEPLHKGVTFRLGGVEREMSLLEFGWRVGLYSERESRDAATLSGLRNVETVNAARLTHSIWPNIGDGMKETTNRISEIDLFYLCCIFEEGVVCNIPYWLAKYLKSVRDKSVIFKGMSMTRITRSFSLLNNEMVSVLNREPPLHVYRKTSLVKMGVIMKLYEGECCWPATRGVVEESKGDDEEGNKEGGNKGVGGSMDIYRNMSQDLSGVASYDGYACYVLGNQLLFVSLLICLGKHDCVERIPFEVLLTLWRFSNIVEVCQLCGGLLTSWRFANFVEVCQHRGGFPTSWRFVNLVENGGNQNGHNVDPGTANQYRIGNVVTTQAEGNGAYDKLEKVNVNCTLLDNLQQASTSGTQTDSAPVYDSDGSVEKMMENASE
nr:hypothetical protein [Tanacetum cinerariifolium]